MSFLYFCLCLLSVLVGCKNRDKPNLDSRRDNFIMALFKSTVEEGPFHLNYNLQTVLFSDELISLFGAFDEYTHLPHSHGYYEGKTFYKAAGQWKLITLDDLFVTEEQKEFLISYCERDLKTRTSSYFSGTAPIAATLDWSAMSTFILDHQCLMIVFQPHIAGGYPEGPFIVKIPFEQLKNKWNSSHPFLCLLETVVTSKSFIASWQQEDSLERMKRSNLSTPATFSQAMPNQKF